MKKLSVIVPSYNSAQYLPRCVMSLACQDIDAAEYEVIVVNDGSTDNTSSVLRELQARYGFLKVINKENGGLSSARNRGIEEASGRYVLFVDADDAVIPHTLGIIFQEMEKDNLDMMMMNYTSVTPEQQTLNIPFDIDGNTRQVVSGKDYLKADCFLPMVWSYIYKASFLKENHLRMIPIWHEDEEFTPRAIYFAKRIKYYPILFYVYYQNKGSYMSSANERRSIYMIKAMGSLKRFAESITDSSCRLYLNHRIARTILQLFKRSIRNGDSNQAEIIAEIQKENLFPLRPKSSNLYYILLNHCPELFVRYYFWHVS